MKYDYLTDESEKTLAPFFSPMMLSASFHSIWIVVGMLMLFWPRQPLYRFIDSNKGPLAFFMIFAATLISNAYIGLRCGRGEIIRPDVFSEYRKEVITLEKERNFFQYGLIAFLLHTLCLLLPLSPALILSASISGITVSTFFNALLIVYTACLFCRLFGFLMYLIWGRFRMEGYLLSRLFIVLFLFATAVSLPAFSPIRFLYAFNYELQNGIDYLKLGSYSFYMFSMVLAILSLVLLCHMLIHRHMIREKQRDS